MDTTVITPDHSPPISRRAPDASHEAGTMAAYPMLLHIGLHKTGSTWLQNDIFASAGHGFTTATGGPRHGLVADFVTPDAFHYDAQTMRNAYCDHHRAAAEKGLTLVLSHERLSGYPSSGGHDRRLIADRLFATFPEARVLIVLREQRALIRSMYSQHITDGGTGSIARFLDTPEPALGRRPGFRLSFYEFDRTIAYYKSLFGPDHVLALPFERLLDSPGPFVTDIQAFCGMAGTDIGAVKRVNERRPLVMQLAQRPLNALFFHNELSPGALLHIPRFAKRYARTRRVFEAITPAWLEKSMQARLMQAIDRHVGDYYAESNRKTEQLTGISLARYGYPLPGR
ncbi:sulfotransferase [Sphingobium aromaticiconvertens]|uniref:sulfotransferase n=1 Tax=Sphingobium aromaticiconvertens TaxID=365341 RepID=UPI003016342B